MTRRLVLTEGPDDVAALREIGSRRFQAIATPGSPGARSSTWRSRTGVEVSLTAVPNAKSGLARATHVALEALPPQVAGDEARTDRIAVLYDPDDDRPGQFEDALHAHLAGLSPHPFATFERHGDTWGVQRAGEALIELRTIAWRSHATRIDALPDVQSLDRLLCDVAQRAYPTEVARIAGWLTETAAARQSLQLNPAKWKSAVLFWAALVDEGATSEVGIASRFFGQHKGRPSFFDSHVWPAIEAAGLAEPLAWVFD